MAPLCSLHQDTGPPGKDGADRATSDPNIPSTVLYTLSNRGLIRLWFTVEAKKLETP